MTDADDPKKREALPEDPAANADSSPSGDDDLLADFDDILAAASADTGAAPAPQDEDDLDDLDLDNLLGDEPVDLDDDDGSDPVSDFDELEAFLDEFEKNHGDEARDQEATGGGDGESDDDFSWDELEPAESAPADPTPADPTPEVAEREAVEVPADDLDLSSADDDAVADFADIDLDEAAQGDSEDESIPDLDDFDLSEPDTGSAEASADAATPTPEDDEEDDAEALFAAMMDDAEPVDISDDAVPELPAEDEPEEDETALPELTEEVDDTDSGDGAMGDWDDETPDEWDETPAAAEANTDDGGDELDELDFDSLLDEVGEDVAEEPVQPARDEVAASLDEEELDLSLDDGEEEEELPAFGEDDFAEDFGLSDDESPDDDLVFEEPEDPEPEPAAGDDEDDSLSGALTAGAAAAAATMAVGAAKGEDKTPEPEQEDGAAVAKAKTEDKGKGAKSVSKEKGGGGGRLALVATILGVLGLTGGGVAGWIAMGQSAKVADLETRVLKQEEHPVGAVDARVDSAMAEIKQIHAQLDDLEQRLQGSDATKAMQEVDDLRTRTNTLETAFTGMREAVIALEKRSGVSPTASETMGKAADAGSDKVMAKAEPKPAPAPAAPRRKGDWVVNLASVSTMASARKEQRNLSESGIDADITRADAGGRVWYRLQVTGFEHKAAAREYADQLMSTSNLKGIWVGRR